MDDAPSHIQDVQLNGKMKRKSDILVLGPLVSQHDTSSTDERGRSKEFGNMKGGSADVGMDGMSPTQQSFDNTTTYPPTSLGSDFDSHVSKPGTDIGTPVAQFDDRSPEHDTGHTNHHPVKSFSLPPWAIQTNTNTSDLQNGRSDGLTGGERLQEENEAGIMAPIAEQQHSPSRFVYASSPVAESPFTDDAAVRQQPTGAQLFVPPNTLCPTATVSPSSDGYFPSTLRVNTGLQVAVGPASATSDPYTMHKTVGNDPIHQYTVPNKPRQLHPRSLSTYLAQHPNDTANRAIRKTYPKPNPIFRFFRRFKVRHDVIKGLSEQELSRFEQREGKKRRRLAGWRLAEEDTEEDRIGEDGVERPVVSELFWKVSARAQDCLSNTDHVSSFRCTCPSCQHSSGIRCPAS